MRILPTLALAFTLVAISFVAFSQPRNPPGKQLTIRKSIDRISLDGQLNEETWQKAEIATGFYVNYPVDTIAAEFQTEARVTFDDLFFYVSFVCYDDKMPDIVQSLRRDFDFDTNDNMGICLGPYNDAINGFYFVVSPLGVQLEGTISGGGNGDESFNDTWDNKWFSKVVKYEDRWIAELAIPFKSFRYKSEVNEWNITFLRNDLKRNRVSSWIATPVQFIPASFAYSGKLVWEDHPPHHTTNISLIPYIAGGASQDHETVPASSDSDFQAGLDAKVGITSSLNLDLTINPDFSQVEVDQQVINLTRFEFQFPERRQFFLENSDLFETIGFPESRAFFTRRVGIASDTSGNLSRVPILYGARLSGSLSSKWRTSLLNMHTKEKESIGLPQQNFSVATLQRNFWKQSSMQVSFVNKQSIGLTEDSSRYFNPGLWRYRRVGNDSVKALNKYNRVASIDTELRSADNKYYLSAFVARSFDDFSKDKALAGGAFGEYRTRNVNLFLGESFIQENFNAEAGFVPSRGVYPGIFNTFIGGGLSFYPKKGNIVNHGPAIDISFGHLPTGTLTDRQTAAGYNVNFQNTSSLEFVAAYTYQRLTSTFNPIDEDRYTNYIEGEVHDWINYQLEWNSDQRKLFRYSVETTIGEFYNGTNLNVNGEMSYRYQPFGSLSVRFDYNDLRLPVAYGREKLFIVSPRMDLTFTHKIFFTTFVQYNTLADNVNLNARFQWRYAQASDFFVVYTENYLPQSFGSKNRALVFKFTYWLNL
jgi:hypothetical protein